MSRRKPAVEWGDWGWDRDRCAMVRHGAEVPPPATISDALLVPERTGWWRCVPVRGGRDVEWREAAGPGPGAWHGTLYVERAP